MVETEIETTELVRRAGIKVYQFEYMLKRFPDILTCSRRISGRLMLWPPSAVELVIQLRAGMKKTKDTSPAPSPAPITRS